MIYEEEEIWDVTYKTFKNTGRFGAATVKNSNFDVKTGAKKKSPIVFK